MITAKFIRKLDGWRGDARLYQLSEPVLDGHGKYTDHVIVSGVFVDFTGKPETYIFPANAGGEESNMLDMDGSFQGAIDHKRAITGAGWELEED